MPFKTNFSFTQRKESNFCTNNSMAKKLADTLNRVKGQVIKEMNLNGDLDIQEYLNFKVSMKSGKIPSLEIFESEIEMQGLTVFFVVDCSLSMFYAYDQLRNITATIFQALKKCPFIKFEVIAYSGAHSGHEAKIQEINKLDDVKFITADRDNRLTPTDLALSYAHEKIRKAEGKKLVILFTDGLPESAQYGYLDLQDKVKQQLVKMRNDKINFFSVFFQNKEYCKGGRHDLEHITKTMREIFKGTMYESDNFNDIEKYLQKQLIKSVEKINQQ